MDKKIAFPQLVHMFVYTQQTICEQKDNCIKTTYEMKKMDHYFFVQGFWNLALNSQN
jgi:hypothetical protein